MLDTIDTGPLEVKTAFTFKEDAYVLKDEHLQRLKFQEIMLVIPPRDKSFSVARRMLMLPEDSSTNPRNAGSNDLLNIRN